VPEFTTTDRRHARAMGIDLDTHDSRDEAELRLYNTLVTAYQRLDDECARVHQAERQVRAERDRWRRWAMGLLWPLAIAVGLVLGGIVVILR
jgi:hypothetical protein